MADGRAFVGRHDGKGILVFADGHSEIAEIGDLLDQRGKVGFPQEKYVWTLDPDDDPN